LLILQSNPSVVSKIFIALKREGFENILLRYKDNEAIFATFGIDIIKAEEQEAERKI